MKEDISSLLIKQLEQVKEEYIKMKNELEVSIRKDQIKVELKDILQNNTDYDSLKENLTKYINNLL